MSSGVVGSIVWREVLLAQLCGERCCWLNCVEVLLAELCVERCYFFNGVERCCCLNCV